MDCNKLLWHDVKTLSIWTTSTFQAPPTEMAKNVLQQLNAPDSSIWCIYMLHFNECK